jgi:hypothetical protein
VAASPFKVFPKSASTEPESVGMDNYQKTWSAEETARLHLRPLPLLVLMLITFAFVVWLVQVRWNIDGTASGFSCLGVPWLLDRWVLMFRKEVKEGRARSTEMARRQEDIEQRHQFSISTELATAEELTRSLNAAYSDSIEQRRLMIEKLDWAQGWLNRARSEFQSRAFGPFWDAIESSAHLLGEFDSATNKLASNSDDYFVGLNGRSHTFPDFPVKPSELPDPQKTVRDLRAVLRMGQTDFQFANIWEHRQTRAVLIAGFSSLGSALNGLSHSLNQSTNRLTSSISSDVACLVQEQIRTRKELEHTRLEHGEMLDNIQRGEKPLGLH